MAGTRPIVVFNVGGEYFGLFDRCPHQGAPLSEGHLTGLLQSTRPGSFNYTRQDEIIRCPWHGWEFDIRTGRSHCDPARTRTRAYPVAVTEDYAAETVPVSISVSVSGRYVVIDL